MSNCLNCPLHNSSQCHTRVVALPCVHFEAASGRHHNILATLEHHHYTPFISSHEDWHALRNMSMKLQQLGTQSAVFIWSQLHQHYIASTDNDMADGQ